LPELPVEPSNRIAGEIRELVSRARALSDHTDGPARAGLDEHLTVLEQYARRVAGVCDVVAADPAVPSDAAVPSDGNDGEQYLDALRRVTLSPDDGLAAIARHCLRTGGRFWPAAAGSARTFGLRVARAEPTGRDGTLVELEIPPELRADLSWQAGQHLIVTVQHGGVDLQRHYSICAPTGALHEGRVRFAVRRVLDGLGSPQLIRSARVGAVMEIGRPTGDMVWPPEGGPPPTVLLVAAGSGVTPLYAIAAEALAESDARVGMLVIERAPDDVMLGAQFAELRERYGARFAYSGLWTRGPDGRPTTDSLVPWADGLCRQLAREPRDVPLVYLCGPDPVMTLVEAALASAGCVGATVHKESFTSDRPAIESEGARPGGTLRVALDDGEHDIELRPGESLLAAMIRSGIDHPFSCLSGICKTCRVTVTAGAVGPDTACLGSDASGMQVLACIGANRVDDGATAPATVS
jgi:ring-1,2-phenylacetyl-CoA epoxidase subunit PaaE